MFYRWLGPKMADDERERTYVEEVAALGLFEPQAIERREAPDFVVRSKGQRVGLEVPEILDRRSREGDVVLGRVPERAAEIYNSRHPKEPVDVVVSYARTERLSQGTLADSLSAFVEQHTTDPAHHRENLPDGFSSIRIRRPPISSPGTWENAVDSAGTTEWISRDLIATALAMKQAKLPTYRQHLPDLPIWLLIVNDQMRAPREQLANPKDLENWTFTFGFDRVLLYRRHLETPPMSVVELRRA